ncbi:MAG: hypothetical protein H6Q15_599 [Bacteroidetes bacterium]|nr:hypothetical protein [Bacteroidota bacterium]
MGNKNIILIIFSILFAIILNAQNNTHLTPTIDGKVIDFSNYEGNSSFKEGISRTCTWNKYFWADINSTISRGEIALATNYAKEYDWANKGTKNRLYVFSNLGVDFPVWAGNFNSGRNGFSVTVPFLIDVWLDMFERTTAPIINTQYRFGLPEFGFIHRFENKKLLGIRNYSLRLSPMKHECTHIGDELALKRIQDGLSIIRVNVSYNFYELMFTLNDHDGTNNSNLSARFGALMIQKFTKGWYNILSTPNGDIKLLNSKESPFEFYFQLEYQTNTSKNSNLQGVFSFECRSRVNYLFNDYIKKMEYYEPIREDGIFNFNEMNWFNLNFFAGFRYNNPRLMKLHRLGFGLRYYHGIIPYGQFRNLMDFNQLGFSILFE